MHFLKRRLKSDQHQKHENERFIDSIAATAQGATQNVTMGDTSVRKLTVLLQVFTLHIQVTRWLSFMVSLLTFCNWLWGPENGLLPTTGETDQLSMTTYINFRPHFKFIDNFNVFWNSKECFKPDGIRPNITGCRLLSPTACFMLLTCHIKTRMNK